MRAKIISPAVRLNRFTNHTTSYTIKNPKGELFTYTPSGKVKEVKDIPLRHSLEYFMVAATIFLNFCLSYFCKLCRCLIKVLMSLPPQRVVVSAVKSSAQLSTKQLLELLFSTQAIRHCKTTPSLQHGFLVQVKQKKKCTTIICQRRKLKSHCTMSHNSGCADN